MGSRKSGKSSVANYYVSQLTVNGHLLRHYQRSSVGAPYIQQRKGKNTVTLYFEQAKWFTALLVISLVGLSILAIYGLYYFCTHVKKYFKGIAAGQIS